MKKETKIIVITVAVLVVVFAAAAFWFRGQEKAAQEETVQNFSSALVQNYHPTIGPENAKVTVVEFFDPECEACRAMQPVVKMVLQEFPNDVRIHFRYMPFHNNSVYAANVLEIARAQGKYFEALELLYEKQPEWGDHHNPRPELIKTYMASLGVNLSEMDDMMKNGQILKRIEQDKNDGTSLGVNGTPTFFVNGKMVQDLGYAPLKDAIHQALTSP